MTQPFDLPMVVSCSARSAEPDRYWWTPASNHTQQTWEDQITAAALDP